MGHHMIYLESIISKQSCQKIVNSIESCINKYGSGIGNEETLRVFDNHDSPEMFSLFASIPEIDDVRGLSKFGSMLTSSDIENPEILHITFGWYEKYSSLGAHSDVGSDPILELSFTAVIYFNDDYEGGELVIYDKELSPKHFRTRNLVESPPARREVAKIKPPTGSVVIIGPGVFHEVLPISSGEKYIATILFYKKGGENHESKS